MTYAPVRLPAAARPGLGTLFARLGSALATAHDRYAARRTYRHGLQQLREMDAALLKDVGVTRDEVEHLIRKSKTRWLI